MAQVGGEHGPWGATREGDADSYQVFYLANNLDPATEAIEADMPAVVLRKEYAPDTSGAGYNRGGAAVLKDTMFLRESHHFSMPLHLKKPSGTGVNGGEYGPTGGTWVIEPEAFDVPNAKELPLHGRRLAEGHHAGRRHAEPRDQAAGPGRRVLLLRARPDVGHQAAHVFRYQTNGGGGCGNPLEREPERVKIDVRDGYVTIEGALRDYGVVVAGDPRTTPRA